MNRSRILLVEDWCTHTTWLAFASPALPSSLTCQLSCNWTLHVSSRGGLLRGNEAEVDQHRLGNFGRDSLMLRSSSQILDSGNAVLDSFAEMDWAGIVCMRSYTWEKGPLHPGGEDCAKFAFRISLYQEAVPFCSILGSTVCRWVCLFPGEKHFRLNNILVRSLTISQVCS